MSNAKVLHESNSVITLECIPDLVKKIVGKVSSLVAGDFDFYGLKLVIYEGLTNAVVHGNRSDPTKAVYFQVSEVDGCLKIIIEDQGEGFDYEGHCSVPTLPGKEATSGRGLLLMLTYGYEPFYELNGRRLILSKKLRE